VPSKNITIYTDGSSRGNPGPGGFGVIMMSGSHKKEIAQGYRHTTNNRMELLAVIAGIRALKKDGLTVTVYSDSQYVVKAVKEGWLDKWIRTNFKGGKKNKDLWLSYYELSKRFHINMVWVKGHADNPFNNRCDELATTAADAPTHELLIDEEYESSID
jgi:ribonuclease HI